MSSDSTEERTDPALAMVAVASSRLPDASAIAAAVGAKRGGLLGVVGSLFGKKPSVSPDVRWDGTNLIFPYRDAHLAVSLMPAPIPWGDLEGPCATAWWWPEATQTMRAHTHHFLVALIGGSIQPVERRVVLTSAVRAVVEGSDAVGVYWCEGTLVHQPDTFLEETRSVSASDIPGPIWIDVRVEPNPDGTARCFTTGMAPLGFQEIEVARSDWPPADLGEFIGNTACYIVNSRKPIPDGDTLGRSASEKFTDRKSVV